MNSFNKILSDIRKLKIQSARSVAVAGIKAFLLKSDKTSVQEILKTRPTEPLMQNAIKFLHKSKNPEKAAEYFLDYLKKSDEQISTYGLKLIKNDMNIFTHCHSTTVVNILKYAKKQKKKFVVYTTETDPMLQGRKTAIELAKLEIPVIHVPDTATEYSLKKCDLFLFGADAFLKKGIVNKIGTAQYCQIAKSCNIPAYSCGISLKFAKKTKLEMRKPSEVWNQKNKNIKVLNPAFDFVPKKLLTGVVSEFGVLRYGDFIRKAKRNLKRFV